MRMLLPTLSLLLALAQQAKASENDVYIDIYWESPNGNWNADMAATGPSAGTDSNSPLYTMDEIDALVHALSVSDYYSYMQPYGLASVAPPLPSLMVTTCGSPPATIFGAAPGGCSGSNDGSAINAFVDCVVSTYASELTVPGKNVILNVLIPPWVGAGNPQTDYCIVTGEGGCNVGIDGYTVLLLVCEQRHCRPTRPSPLQAESRSCQLGQAPEIIRIGRVAAESLDRIRSNFSKNRGPK